MSYIENVIKLKYSNIFSSFTSSYEITRKVLFKEKEPIRLTVSKIRSIKKKKFPTCLVNSLHILLNTALVNYM